MYAGKSSLTMASNALFAFSSKSGLLELVVGSTVAYQYEFLRVKLTNIILLVKSKCSIASNACATALE